MSVLTAETRKSWAMVDPLFRIRHEREYTQAVKRLHHLLDEVGTDEHHPL